MSDRAKTGLAIFGLSILTILAFELMARGVIFVADSVLKTGSTENRARAAAYDGVEYDAAQLVEEEEAIGKAYQPFTLWQARPYKGTLVNVDEQGKRVTRHNSDREDALQVWMMGGSTMFGIGAPDDQTIASHLSKQLNDAWGVDVQVHNLGQEAYVTTQELIFLVRLLQTGELPDVVMFYDGFNDATAGGSRSWGVHFNLSTISDKFEKNLVPFVRSMASFRVATKLSQKLPGSGNVAAAGEAMPSGPVSKAEGAAKVLIENYKIVSSLGDTHQFTPIFLFQPANARGDKPYHPSEQRMMGLENSEPGAGFEDSVMHSMRRAIQTELREGNTDLNYYDISDVFKDSPEPIYVDFVHVNGTGNQIIAARIFEILKTQLCRETPRRASDLVRNQLTTACVDTLVRGRHP